MKKRDEDEPALDEDDAEGDGDDDERLDEPEPLIPEGNPLQPRGAIALGAGLLVALVVMTLKGQYAIGVPLGALAVCVAAFGALDLIGSFDDADDLVARRLTLVELGRALGLFVGGAFALWLSVTLAVAGMFSSLPLPPAYTTGAAITASFLVAVVGAFRLLDALGCFAPEADGTRRPLLHRHGFWLVVLMALVYLPALGSHSLTDPWETHYGEVSREILARNDWISLWWAQDGWFWSKPVLDMWIQALAMAVFGVRYHPGGMLSAVAEGREPFPEWGVRLPMFLMTVGAVYLLYRACRDVFGRRAAMLGGLVLATMPQWFLIGHQTVTDMPFVAPMVASMALFLMGMNADPERRVRAVEIDVFGLKLRVTLFHVVLGVITACALPQILYLVSRNLEIRGSPFDLRVRGDAFIGGSPGNCGLPGNEACKPFTPVLHGLYPSLQALIWTQALALLFYLNWGERRVDRLYFLAAWFFAALSTMGKGPAGVGLPVLAALAYVGVSRRWKDLLRMEIAGGALVVACVALPWFVAMYARHGQPFTDRLLFHDMFKRAFTHVHDTNEGDDVSFRFYVWQLGYAMFPWTGLAPIGLVAWLRRRERGPKSEASTLLGMWFLLSCALLSLMLTKFHHYILPAVPPAAMLIGVALDEALGGDTPASSFAARAKYFGGTLAASLALALGAALMFDARAALFTAGAGAFFAKAWLGVTLFVVGAAGLGFGARAPRCALTPRRRIQITPTGTRSRRPRRSGAARRSCCSSAATCPRRSRACRARSASCTCSRTTTSGRGPSRSTSRARCGRRRSSARSSRWPSRSRACAGTPPSRSRRARSCSPPGASTCTSRGRRRTGVSATRRSPTSAPSRRSPARSSRTR